MSTRPPLDLELDTLLAALPPLPALGPGTLAQLRPYASTAVDRVLAGRPIDRRDVADPALTVLSPPGVTAAPCVYWIHGGGMVMGDRFSQIDIPLEWLEQLGVVVVTVEYRLAPEAGGAALVEDCYAGLLWVADHAAELGVDPDRIVVAGASAGGGLAAGVALLARDRGGPAVAAQLLIGPMLDHRNDSTSSRQFAGVPGVWPREANEFGWQSVLAGGTVSPYVSPALAADLSGLPATYIDAGSAEVFRDEDVAYATGIWAAGGQAELHVWAGGSHGFDAMFPQAAVSVAARRTRSDWLARVLGGLS
ncbi:alpha/beta hydrolase [Symbioplanes lichenis]|uniref:alpha/beta hydrolase n=1 Tax=Symbioplanes lichenis TaxID=1629072 RepID=UPI002739F808|nr:alpha/beta hydrolase fold domain-containing protein [Actinoplanes lichenis]